mgnify:CR=1 FL=1
MVGETLTEPGTLIYLVTISDLAAPGDKFGLHAFSTSDETVYRIEAEVLSPDRVKYEYRREGGPAAGSSHAVEYLIDTKGAHAFIQFHIKHLGYSWLVGRFNTFSGSFDYDEKNPDAASITVDIDTTSIDSNHAERDKHLRSGDFLDVSKHPPWSMATSTITAPGFIVESCARVTSFGAAAPGISTAPMTISARVISSAVASALA